MIHNFEIVYLCTLYYLKRTFIHSLKNGVGLFSTGVTKLYDFSLYRLSTGLFYTLYDEKHGAGYFGKRKQQKIVISVILHTSKICFIPEILESFILSSEKGILVDML